MENQCLQIEDANCAEPVVLYRDVDEDGFGDPLEVTAGCTKTGFVDRGGDCDDTVASIYPDAPEQCNDIDDDCDGVVDDDPETLSPGSQTSTATDSAHKGRSWSRASSPRGPSRTHSIATTKTTR